MSQLSFSDAEHAGKRKKTQREVFLEEMEQVVPWKSLLGVISPHYPVAGRGRRPYPLESMLRVHLMQNWFALSDPAMEEALYEIASLRAFANLSLSEPIPDETTILNFQTNARVKNPTMRKRLIDARVGQGKFRTDLLGSFGSRCAVSGLSITDALRASHIVGWRDPSTNDEERLDAENGLLLSSNVDALFDRHLISFHADGTAVHSVLLSEKQLEQVGTVNRLCSKPSRKRAAYLQRHRDIFEGKEQIRRKALQKRI
jgi:predicted restriction endonuclease